MKYTDTLSLKLVMCHGLYHDGGGASGQIGHAVAYIKHAFKVGPRPPQPVAVWRRATQGPAAGIGRPADGRNSSFTDSRRHRRAHSLLVSQTSDKRGPRASTCCGAARAAAARAACPSFGPRELRRAPRAGSLQGAAALQPRRAARADLPQDVRRRDTIRRMRAAHTRAGGQVVSRDTLERSSVCDNPRTRDPLECGLPRETAYP